VNTELLASPVQYIRVVFMVAGDGANPMRSQELVFVQHALQQTRDLVFAQQPNQTQVGRTPLLVEPYGAQLRMDLGGFTDEVASHRDPLLCLWGDQHAGGERQQPYQRPDLQALRTSVREA